MRVLARAVPSLDFYMPVFRQIPLSLLFTAFWFLVPRSTGLRNLGFSDLDLWELRPIPCL